MIKRDDIPLGFTYNAQGKELTYKNGGGYWYECTYDANGNALIELVVRFWLGLRVKLARRLPALLWL